MGRTARLWGGPMDGASVAFADSEQLPARVGMYRTREGRLVPIRSGALDHDPAPGAVDVYERVTMPTLRNWRAMVGSTARLFDPEDYQTLAEVPLYVHRELVTRWAVRGGT